MYAASRKSKRIRAQDQLPPMARSQHPLTRVRGALRTAKKPDTLVMLCFDLIDDLTRQYSRIARNVEALAVQTNRQLAELIQLSYNKNKTKIADGENMHQQLCLCAAWKACKNRGVASPLEVPLWKPLWQFGPRSNSKFIMSLEYSRLQTSDSLRQ